MDEIAAILTKQSPSQQTDLSTWLYAHHSVIARCSSSERADFLDRLVGFLNNKPDDIPLDQWESMKLLCYTFIAMLHPQPECVKDISLQQVTNGPLFRTIFTLMFVQHKRDEKTLMFYSDIFGAMMREAVADSEPKSFYSITPASYFAALPSVFEPVLMQQPFVDYIQSFLRVVVRMEPQQLTCGQLHFISEMYKVLKQCLTKETAPLFPPEFTTGLFKLVEMGAKISPSLFLVLFFHCWLFLVKKCHELIDVKVLRDNFTLITELFESTSRLKHHELGRSFQWYFVFWFYDFIVRDDHLLKIRVLALIANCVRTVPRLETLSRISEAVKVLVSRVVTPVSDTWFYTCYLLTNFRSTMMAATASLEKIHGCGGIGIGSDRKGDICRRKLTFKEQDSGTGPCHTFDEYITTTVTERSFVNKEEAAKYYFYALKLSESVKGKIHSVALFDVLIAMKLGAMFNEQSPADDRSNTMFYYLTSMFEEFLDFVIQVSWKQTELNTYPHKHLMPELEAMGYLPSLILTPSHIFQYSAIFKSFYDVIDKFPHAYLTAIARRFALKLFDAMKKGVLTLIFMQNFWHLEKGNRQGYEQHRLFDLVLRRMMDIAYDNIHMLLSTKAEDVQLLHDWLLFTIRLSSTPNCRRGVNRSFGTTLKIFQRSISNAVFQNLKHISNQIIALRIVDRFSQAVTMNYCAKSKGPVTSTLRPYFPQAVDSDNFSKGTNLRIVLKELEQVCHKVPVHILAPLLDNAFATGEKETVTVAASICVRLFGSESSWQNSADEIARRVYRRFLDSIHILDEPLARKASGIMVTYLPDHLNTAYQVETLSAPFMVDGINVDTFQILTAVSEALTDSEEDIACLLALLDRILRGIVPKTIASNPINKTLRLSIELLFHCSTFGRFRRAVNALSEFITKAFGDIFLNGESCVYPLCLFAVIGKNRFKNSGYLTKLAHMFFQYCAGKQLEFFWVDQCIECLFWEFDPDVRVYGILVGFSFFTRYYPKEITLDQLKNFLIQTTDIMWSDTVFSKTLNATLKSFLAANGPEIAKEFVKMTYSIICPLSMVVRQVLEKRLYKLKIPLPVTSFREIIETPDPLLLYQRLTLAFLCEIQGEIVLDGEIKERIVSLLNPSSNGHLPKLERLARILSLSLAVLSREQVFNELSRTEHFIPQFLQVLFQSLLLLVKPLRKYAKKCFLILYSKFHNDPKVLQQADDYWASPGKIFSFWETQIERTNRIRFYARLTKVRPDKVPPEVVLDFFNEAFRYLDKTDAEKMAHIHNFYAILKQLSVKEYMSLPAVRELTSRQYQEKTYLETFIDMILKLMRHDEIPVLSVCRKPITKFFEVFPRQVFEYLSYQSNDSFSNEVILAEQLIVHDKGFDFLETFLSIVREYQLSESNATRICIFAIIERLSRYSRFTCHSGFKELVERMTRMVAKTCHDNKRRVENQFEMLLQLGTAHIRIARAMPGKAEVLTGALLFSQVPYFDDSYLHRLFSDTLFFAENETVYTFLFTKLAGRKFGGKKAPKKMLELLIPHMLKKLPVLNPSFIESAWNALFSVMDDGEPAEELTVTLLKSFRYLISRAKPSPQNLQRLLTLSGGFKKWMLSPNPEIIVYSLKLVIQLAELNYLPQVLFHTLVEQLFTFQKFWDVPYGSYFAELIRIKRSWMLSLPLNVISTVAFYVHDKCTNYREMQKIISTLAPCRGFFKLLPFSLFVGLCSVMEQQIENCTTENVNLKDRIVFMSTISKSLEITMEEIVNFVNLVFKYIGVQFKHPQGFCSDPLESFFQIVTQCAPDHFPIAMILEIPDGPMSSLAFSVVATACHMCPVVMLDKHRLIIERAIQLLSDEREQLPKRHVKYLMSAIFQDGHRAGQLSQCYMGVLETLIRYWRPATQERAIALCTNIVAHRFGTEYQRVLALVCSAFDVMTKTPDQTAGCAAHFKMMVKIVQLLENGEQRRYWALLLERVMNSDICKKQFTLYLPKLILSKTITNAVKLKIMKKLPRTIMGTESSIMQIITSLNTFSATSKIDLLPHIVMVYLTLAKASSSCMTVSRALEAIGNLLPADMGARVRFALKKMPMLVWGNDYLPVMVATFTDSTSQVNIAWMAFSPRLTSIGATLFVSAMLPVLCDEVQSDLYDLLVKALNQEDKQNYQSVIEGILRLCQESLRYLPAPVLAKAAKRCPCSAMPEMIHHADFCPDMRFLLPGVANDSLFGIYSPTLSKTEAMAIALTCLDQYDAAKCLYDSFDSESEFVKKMRLVNEQFVRYDKETLTFDDIVRPLLKPGRLDSTVISSLRQAYQKFSEGAMEAVGPLLEETQLTNLEKFKAHPNPAQYSKQVFAVVESMVAMLRNRVEGGSGPSPMTNSMAFLHPVLLQTLSDFERLLSGLPPERQMKINSDSAPAILMGPRMSEQLEAAACVTPKGLIAMGAPEINRYLAVMSDNIREDNVELADWWAFAPFCYEVFCAQQNLSCFGLAFRAYCHMVRSKDQSSFMRQQAAARVITLVRYAIGQNEHSFIKLVEAANMFGKEYAEIWRFWLQQLIMLSNTPWFFELAKPLFHEMTYRSTLYARKYCTKDVENALLSLCTRGSGTVQIQIMDTVAEFCRSVMSLDIACMLNLYHFRVFISEALRLSDEDVQKVNLLELRKKRHPMNSFESSIEFLTKSQIKAIGNFPEFVHKMRKLSEEERDKFLRESTGAGVLLTNHITDVQERVSKFNNELPFIFPIRQDTVSQISIYRVNKDVAVISPELMTFTATTSLESHHTFLVQQSSNPDGFHPSVMTIATSLLLFRRILNSCYATAHRKVQMPVLFSFEVGENILLVPLPSQAISLKSLFESDMMTTLDEWKAKYITDGTLNEKGKRSIKKFPMDALNSRIVETTTRSSFATIMSVALGSYASASLVRYLFGAPYPGLDRTIACARTGEIPILCADFDTGTFPEETTWSPIRLSPIICATLGPSFKENIALSLSAIASAFTSQIESIRACLETILCDELNGAPFSITTLLAERTKLENKLIAIAPPSTRSNTPDTSSEWLNHLLAITDKATDPWIQPADAIPWY